MFMKIGSVYIHGKYHKAAGITHTVAVVGCLQESSSQPFANDLNWIQTSRARSPGTRCQLKMNVYRIIMLSNQMVVVTANSMQVIVGAAFI